MAGNVIDYNDQRLTDVEKESAQRKQEVTNNFNQMINDRDLYTQQQQQNVANWAQQQTELQQAKTDQTINKITQSKEQGAKDYAREQKGAYTDYMKQSNQYGANAEMMARQGMSNSGYSESSQVSMWNAYQNRYATARESYQKAVTEWANMMKDAELSNNETLANIAQQKLGQSLKLALEGFEYKNNLTIQRDSRIDEIENYYNNKYQQVLDQINREYEYKRQEEEYQKEYEMKMRQLELEEQQRRDQNEQWEKEYALKKAKTLSTINGYALNNSSGSGQSLSGSSGKAQDVYNAYRVMKSVKKSTTLEGFLETQLRQGKITQDELREIIYNYA